MATKRNTTKQVTKKVTNKVVKQVTKQVTKSKLSTKDSVLNLINEAVRRKTTINKLSLQKKIARNKVANYIYNLDGMVTRKTLSRKDAVEVRRAYKNYLKLAQNF